MPSCLPSSVSTWPGSTSQKPLRPQHEEEIRRRGLSTEFCIKSGCRSVADNEARALGFEAVLPIDQRKNGLQGILFSYRTLDGSGDPLPRLRPDTAPLLDGKPAKYLSRKGEASRPFYPHTTLPEHAKNPNFNVLITEGEFKALSMAEHLLPIASRVTTVIGLNGVNGGWTRDRVVVDKPDGSRETKKAGAIHLTPALGMWEWKGRTVYIVYDSDVGTARHASEFKKSPASGAWGAEFQLAKLLRAKGAEVRIVEIPHPLDGGKLGIDDYILRYGKHAGLALIYNNWTTARDVDRALYRSESGSLSFESASALVQAAPARPEFVIQDVLPVEGCAILAGSPGIGKSGLALSLCACVAAGEPWLGLDVPKGRALYVQAEMPRWSLAERARAAQCNSPDLLMWTPERLYLNLWEPDGFNKKRDTGTREQIARLGESCLKQGMKLLVFDPLGNFLSVSERDEEALKAVFETLRELARYAKMGIFLVHHHRKIGRADTKYEGAEDMSGTNVLYRAPDAVMSMYAYERNDATMRYKLRFSKLRHSAEKIPLELFRRQDSPLMWDCSEWKDSQSPSTGRIESIIAVLAKSRDRGLKAHDIEMATKISHTPLYKELGALVRTGEIRKEGNVYHLGPRAMPSKEDFQRLADDDS